MDEAFENGRKGGTNPKDVLKKRQWDGKCKGCKGACLGWLLL